MSRYLPYNPEQAYLLPPSVKDELGAEHLCCFVHQVVERLDLSVFTEAYSEEGEELYHPALMLKVWLYAYALGLTSGRRLEQRIKEDLGLRYLAGGARPDHWALSAFRRRQAGGISAHGPSARPGRKPRDGKTTRYKGWAGLLGAVRWFHTLTEGVPKSSRASGSDRS